MNGAAHQAIVNRRTDWARSEAGLPLAVPMSGDWPEIDIGAVTYDSARWIDGFMDSLVAQDYPTESIHLRLLDNGSSDDTPARVEAALARHAGQFASVSFARGENVGFGRGHDRLIREGSQALCLVTNVDLTFEATTLTELVGMALVDDGGTTMFEARQKPYEHPKFYDPVTGETNWCAHACVLMRRDAYLAAGGYDPNLFLYGEDVELSYRLRAEGNQLRYVPQAAVWHHTYDSAGAVKPLQYSGSTFANAYLRLRYGRLRDAWTGFVMLLGLLAKREAYPGARRAVLGNGLRLLRRGRNVLAARRETGAAFPFRGWDYDVAREGAFVATATATEPAPLVSIVIRTYRGRQPLLRQALASALQQTHPRIEVIVVEDGGDETRAVVDSMAADSPHPVRFIAMEKAGRSAAGNAGLSVAAGDFINFLDDDDLLFCDHVETLLPALTGTPEVVAAYGLGWMIPTRMTPDFESYEEMAFEMPPIYRQPYSYEVLEHHNYIPIQACLFRRSLYEDRGGFDVALDALEDWNLWLRYAWKARFVHIPKTTSMFRIPADPKMRTARQTGLDDSYAEAFARAREAIHGHAS